MPLRSDRRPCWFTLRKPGKFPTAPKCADCRSCEADRTFWPSDHAFGIPFTQGIPRFCRTMLALSSPCARGAQEYDAPNGGSLDADSAKIGARRHLSMRSIGRALGVDADPATRRSAKAVAGRFQGCESMISFVPGRSITQEPNRTLSAYVMDLFR